MKRSWAVAIIALWILMAVAMNIAFASQAAPSPAIPMDHLVDAFV
jgi:uncharacterized membrane protein YdfJ with MMPL/SSD domain